MIRRVYHLLLHAQPKSRESAGLLINNLAGAGGDEAIVELAKDEQLIKAMLCRLDSEDSLELQRITSAFNHISRSRASSWALRKLRVQEGLVRLLSQTRYRQEEAWMGLATMALANLQGDDGAAYFSANPDTLPHLVEFLRCAVDQIKLNGIYFRVYDVLYSLSHLCRNAMNHAVLSDSGLVGVLCHIVSEWRPGLFEWNYTAQKCGTHPVLEAATDALYHLCESEGCRLLMQDAGIEQVCERFLVTEESVVQEYAAKVLWRVRDRQTAQCEPFESSKTLHESSKTSSKTLNHTERHAARGPAASPGGDAGSAGGAAGALAANPPTFLA